MEEMKSRLILAYLLMLIAQQAQVLEELWEHSFLVALLSDGVYIVAYLALFCISMIILDFVFMDKKWAYYLGIAYAVFMMFLGIERLVYLFVEGIQGITIPVIFTSMIVCIIGIPMVYYLYMNIERLNKQSLSAKRFRAAVKID